MTARDLLALITAVFGAVKIQLEVIKLIAELNKAKKNPDEAAEVEESNATENP